MPELHIGSSDDKVDSVKKRKAEDSGHETKERCFMSVFKRSLMSEKDSWSHQKSEMLSLSYGNTAEASASEKFHIHGFESENAERNGDEFCVSESILSDTANAVDTDSFGYNLDEITTPPEGNFEFLQNTESRNSSDLLGFPELGNFEDVDMMFRSCDATFGDGSKEDDLPWFSTIEELLSKDQIAESGSLSYSNNLLKGPIQQPYEANLCPVLSLRNQHQEEDCDPSSCKHFQSSLSSVGSGKIHSSIVDPLKSYLEAGNSDFNLHSPNDFSLALEQLQTKDENLCPGQATVLEIGSSSKMQESLAMSSVMDDTSLEAASLQQLQLILEKLDIRMKLCIRDSLYRLARSTKQRNHMDSQSNSHLGDNNEGPNSFINIEATTNPIDRSVAQLLFHRPSNSNHSPNS